MRKVFEEYGGVVVTVVAVVALIAFVTFMMSSTGVLSNSFQDIVRRFVISSDAMIDMSIDAAQGTLSGTASNTGGAGDNGAGGAGESVLGCDTLYWDGNAEGLVFVDLGVGAYRVSDVGIPAEALANGGVLCFSVGGQTMEAPFTSGDLMCDDNVVLLAEIVLFAAEDGVVVEDTVLPMRGIYIPETFFSVGGFITINGFTGFPHSDQCGH